MKLLYAVCCLGLSALCPGKRSLPPSFPVGLERQYSTHQMQHETDYQLSSGSRFLPGFAPCVASEVVNSSAWNTSKSPSALTRSRMLLSAMKVPSAQLQHCREQGRSTESCLGHEKPTASTRPGTLALERPELGSLTTILYGAWLWTESQQAQKSSRTCLNVT